MRSAALGVVEKGGNDGLCVPSGGADKSQRTTWDILNRTQNSCLEESYCCKLVIFYWRALKLLGL